jgi:hypothetical protein
MVRVVKILVGGAEVMPDVPFEAGDDWFKDVGIVIENLTTRRIVFVSGQLRFPETGDATAENLAVMARISAGQRPHRTPSSEGTGARPDDVPGPIISVEPGHQAMVPVVEKFERVKTMIEKKQPLSTVTTCVAGINTLLFDDGTEWMSPGLYFRPDPDMPGRHVRISQKEFDSYRQEAPQ